MQIDLILTPQQHLLAMISAANTSHKLDASHIRFGPPHQSCQEPAGRNTTVTVTAIEGTAFCGSIEVYYQRPALEDVAGSRSRSIPVDDAGSSVQDIKRVVAAHFDLIDSELALETAQPIPLIDDATPCLHASLRPNSDSYLYSGAAMAITLQRHVR